MDQTVELFSGKTQAFSQIASALGYSTFTVDVDPGCSPNLVADIRLLKSADIPQCPLILWATPPDSPAFHDARQWASDGSWFPETTAAETAIELYRATVNLISEINPTWWFVENPTTLLRKMPVNTSFNRGYPSRIRHALKHAAYGGNQIGQSDILTNAYWWKPSTSADRANDEAPAQRRVPPFVFAEIFDQLTLTRTSEHMRS